jgi:hypothetical protein
VGGHLLPFARVVSCAPCALACCFPLCNFKRTLLSAAGLLCRCPRPARALLVGFSRWLRLAVVLFALVPLLALASAPGRCRPCTLWADPQSPPLFLNFTFHTLHFLKALGRFFLFAVCRLPVRFASLFLTKSLQIYTVNVV